MDELELDFSGTATVKTPRPDLSHGHAVLLDANNLAARSFHAAKGRLSSADGVETGTLHLFCQSLSRFLRDIKPTHMAVCWDGGRSIYRESIYPDYKLARRAGREDTEVPHGPAFGLIVEFLGLCGFDQWYQSGVEADDLIAAAHRRTRAEHSDRQITIMSSDKDMLQLLDDRTHQLRFSSYGTPTDVWDRDRVIRDLGYTPEQIPLVMAFTGDTSDGIPGIKGIGPKKAVKILSTADWDWDAVTPGYPELATMRKLVDLTGPLCCDVDPVPVYQPLSRTSPNAEQRLSLFTDFCARYQLRSLWDDLVNGKLWY